MPTNAEIAKIEASFAQQYGLDLPGIHGDAATLRTVVAAKPINSNLINSISYTYSGSLAFVPDLETTLFSEILPDSRLGPRRVELNLDEAVRHLQNCLQIRQQYGETAKLRNDTRFKGEEFVRLDAVHLQEVEAGLYKLPWQEAADERTGLETAVAQANLQQNIPEEMMRDGAAGNKYSALLSDGRLQNNAESNAFIIKNVANSLKDQVGTQALSTAQYRNSMEYAAWLENLAAAKSNVAQLKAKLSIAQRREQYFRQDEGFKTHRAAISRQLAWLQISENSREGSELNYDEKLRKLKAPFDANLRFLCERVIVLAQGLKEHYGIDLPLGVPKTGSILDDVSVWMIKAQDELSKFKRTQRLAIVSKWSGGVVASASRNSSGLDVFNFDFSVGKADLPNENALLRGVGFEYDGKNERPIALKVLPPQNAWLGVSSDPLFFGRVCPIAPNLDLKPQHPDAFWNGSPIGIWKVEGAFNQAAGPIEDVVMHMWVVSV